jgi:hypothetical protein
MYISQPGQEVKGGSRGIFNPDVQQLTAQSTTRISGATQKTRACARQRLMRAPLLSYNAATA